MCETRCEVRGAWRGRDEVWGLDQEVLNNKSCNELTHGQPQTNSQRSWILLKYFGTTFHSASLAVVHYVGANALEDDRRHGII